MQESFLTVQEVAELLKLNQQTVRNWIDRGELPAVRVGKRRVRIRQSDLDRLLTSGETLGEERHVVDPRSSPEIEVQWSQLAESFAESSRAKKDGSRETLIASLHELAETARALAESLSRG